MHLSRLSYTFLTSFAVTVLILQWYQQPTYPAIIWTVLGILGLFGILACPPKPWRRRGLVLSKTRPAAIITLSLTLGIVSALVSVSHSTHVPSPATIDWHASGSGSVIHGMIADAPDRRSGSTKYVVAAKSILIGDQSIPVHGNVLVTDHSAVPYQYGDRVTVRGELERPGAIEDFRYDQYLSRYSMYAVIYKANLNRSGPNEGWMILRWLYAFRRSVEDRITVLYPEPQASLLIGLLTGSRGSMPEDLSEQFKITGLTHLVAISGYNITMVITVLSMLLFWLPLKWRFIPSIALIAAFTLFTGASASVVRAAVMGCLGLFAIQTGRLQTTRLTLLWTVFVMLSWNPKQLWYDAGFQLSFLAFIGITEVAPLLDRLVTILPEKFGIRQTLQLTLAAQIATVPWMLHLFGRLSLIAPVANLFAPPLVPWAMLFGTFSLMGSVVSPLIGQLLSIPTYVALSGITLVTRTLATVPFASLDAPKVGAAFLVGSYGLLGILIWRRERGLRGEALQKVSSP